MVGFGVPDTASKRHPGALTRRSAAKLFVITKRRDGPPMLFIAAGLTIALVTADLFDLSRLGPRRDHH